MGFARMMNLKNHLNYVHVERKFECENCEQKFKTKGTLKEHISQIHEKSSESVKTVQICQYCKEVFKSKTQRYNHIRKVHKPFDPDKKRKTVSDYRKVEKKCP